MNVFAGGCQHFCGRSQMFSATLDGAHGGSFRGCSQFLGATPNLAYPRARAGVGAQGPPLQPSPECGRLDGGGTAHPRSTFPGGCPEPPAGLWGQAPLRTPVGATPPGRRSRRHRQGESRPLSCQRQIPARGSSQTLRRLLGVPPWSETWPPHPAPSPRLRASGLTCPQKAPQRRDSVHSATGSTVGSLSWRQACRLSPWSGQDSLWLERGPRKTRGPLSTCTLH